MGVVHNVTVLLITNLFFLLIGRGMELRPTAEQRHITTLMYCTLFTENRTPSRSVKGISNILIWSSRHFHFPNLLHILQAPKPDANSMFRRSKIEDRNVNCRGRVQDS